MGAWGMGSFDNDDAGDWVCELVDGDDPDFLNKTFDQVLEIGDDYLENPEAGSGVAAAEVVAALVGRPSQDLPDEVSDWIAGKDKPKHDLLKKAQTALKRILKQSELEDSIIDPKDAVEWRNGVENLLNRLTDPIA